MTVEQPPGSEENGSVAPDPDGSASTPGDELPLDVVFGILKNRRRRLVLRYLVEVSETSTLSDLAEHVAGIENDKPEQALTSSERKRVYVCLYQCHLPKMDDAGVIDFDDDRGTVRLDGNTEQLIRYMDTDGADPAIDWPKYYTVLAAIGGGLFVVQQLVFPSDVLSGIIIGAVLGLFINLALEQTYERGTLFPEAVSYRNRANEPADTN